METHKITQIRRLRNSVSGNPRWKVVLDNGVTTYTDPDSTLGYSIETDWVGQAMKVAYEPRGVVNILTAIENPA